MLKTAGTPAISGISTTDAWTPTMAETPGTEEMSTTEGHQQRWDTKDKRMSTTVEMPK
jgi:hypothetical protein